MLIVNKEVDGPPTGYLQRNAGKNNHSVAEISQTQIEALVKNVLGHFEEKLVEVRESAAVDVPRTVDEILNIDAQ
jgi:enoyl-[acyl-carrier-protein] reductase (NADH)